MHATLDSQLSWNDSTWPAHISMQIVIWKLCYFNGWRRLKRVGWAFSHSTAVLHVRLPFSIIINSSRTIWKISVYLDFGHLRHCWYKSQCQKTFQIHESLSKFSVGRQSQWFLWVHKTILLMKQTIVYVRAQARAHLVTHFRHFRKKTKCQRESFLV